MARSSELGAWGEEQAARFLRQNGYVIAEHNFRTRFGEIDLIAENLDYIVFVEVKLRKSSRYGTPAEYVTKKKQQKLRIAAEIWLQHHEIKRQPRFDVIEIYAPNGMDTKPIPIRHIENAF